MSEFSEQDYQKWLQLSIQKHCSLYDAIQYTFFFDGQDKIMRAYRALLHEYNLEENK